ncbi:phosphatase PAP2 family protein [Candidatus Leptofilum sp.]|uniref:phosphatase PAP2 family protein n=1 Tax=Candidatus Leptofilum sp. TaxID=3241576 RepID=UPI003B59F4E6
MKLPPLDQLAQNRIGFVKAARIYSNVVSPPVMFAVVGLAFGLYALPNWAGFLWAAVYGLLVSLAPILVVVYLLKTGRIAELHMSNTRERSIPYISAVLFAAIAYGLIAGFNGPELLRCLALFNVIELTALAIINHFWLISLHATGAIASAVLVWLVFGWQAGLIVGIPLVGSVCWVRLFLKRHTPAQIVAGLWLGTAVVLILVPFGCFVG